MFVRSGFARPRQLLVASSTIIIIIIPVPKPYRDLLLSHKPPCFDGHSCVFLLSMSLSPSPTTSSSSSSSSSSLSSFAVHTNSLCPPLIQLLAQSTYSSLDDCPTDCQTVRQSSISISTISTSLPSTLPSCPRLSFGWLLPPFG